MKKTWYIFAGVLTVLVAGGLANNYKQYGQLTVPEQPSVTVILDVPALFTMTPAQVESKFGPSIYKETLNPATDLSRGAELRDYQTPIRFGVVFDQNGAAQRVYLMKITPENLADYAIWLPKYGLHPESEWDEKAPGRATWYDMDGFMVDLLIHPQNETADWVNVYKK